MIASPITVVVIASSLVVLSGSSVNADQSSPRLAPSVSAVASQASTGRYAAAVSHPVADPDYPAEGSTSVDALHYGLNLIWNATTRTLAGVATIRFRATRNTSSISLDLERALQVSGVTIDGHPITERQRNHKLHITTGPLSKNSHHTLVIGYAGRPHPIPAPTTRGDIPDLGWTVQPDGEVWTMQEPYGALTWYPVNDQPSDKAFYDITVHSRKSWRAVSNGRLMSNTVAGIERTMHWRLKSPVSSYLVTIAIGPYRAYRDKGPHGLPITYWVRPVDNSYLTQLRRTPAMIRWLESKLGRFPFDRIGTVLVPASSGMETQTMVTLGARDLRRPTGVSDLVHEYAHQWYGDSVTPKTWPDVWLNESFAMYVQIRWEASHGFATLQGWRAELNRYDQMLRTKYGPPGRYDPRNFAELNVYFCGARMLDRLHSKLGNRLFEKVLKGWPRQHRYGNANRSEWIHYLDRETGRDLKPFVTRWLDSKISPT